MTSLSYLIFKDSELLTCLLLWILPALAILVFLRLSPSSKPKNTRVHHSVLSYVRNSDPLPSMTRNDLACCLLLTLFTAVFTLHQLGSTVFPHTTWQPSTSDPQTIVLELPEETQFNAVYTISCEGDNNALDYGFQLGTENAVIEGSNDAQNYDTIAVLGEGSIYQYTITRGEWDYRFIRLTFVNPLNTLTEIGFAVEQEERFLPVRVYRDAFADSSYPARWIVDEQDQLVIKPTFYDQGYFDEIYHVRNAAEIAYGQDMYYSVHPLLGTSLIALSIKAFGLTPFAWRLPGALFSIAIVPLMYAFAHMLFSKTLISCTASLLTAADFMHLTTGRIATLEPFSIFFILLMFYWMVRYARSSWNDTPIGTQMKYLLYSGIAMGLGIAVKWTACYSAVGLAILLFTNLFARLREGALAKKHLLDDAISEEERKAAMQVKADTYVNTAQTITLCFLFFIFIPAAIYWLSFVPCRVWKHAGWTIGNVWAHNAAMYDYHTTLVSSHTFQSQWYQWLLDLRPIWYYYGMDAANRLHTISCFSNPLLTWAGLSAIGYTAFYAVRHKDRTAWFLIVGYLTALVPWISFVERCVFSYHFYPASIFTAGAIAFTADRLCRNRTGKTVLILFLVLYVLLFLYFLPVTAGFGTTGEMIHRLEWLKGWYFG